MVAAKTPQANQTLSQRSHSSKWAIDWSAKDSEPAAAKPAKFQSVAEPVHHSGQTEKEQKIKENVAKEASVDDLVKQADNNRADWEKKKTEEIRQEEEQRATHKNDLKLQEENDALRRQQKEMKEAHEKEMKESENKH